MITKTSLKLKMPHFSFFAFNILMFIFAAHAQATLYLVHDNSPNALYTVDTTTAAVTLVGAGNSGDSEGLALGTDNTFFYSIGSSDPVATILADGSAFTPIGGTPAGDRGLTFNRVTNTLYGSDGSNFGTINTTTGAFSALAAPAFDTECLAADSANNLIYGVYGNDDLAVYTVATDTWAVVGALVLGDANDCGLAYDPATTTLYYAENDDNLYRINPATAAITLIGDISAAGGTDYGLAFVPDALIIPRTIPVLGFWGLLIMISIIALIAIKRKSKIRLPYQ